MRAVPEVGRHTTVNARVGDSTPSRFQGLAIGDERSHKESPVLTDRQGQIRVGFAQHHADATGQSTVFEQGTPDIRRRGLRTSRLRQTNRQFRSPATWLRRQQMRVADFGASRFLSRQCRKQAERRFNPSS